MGARMRLGGLPGEGTGDALQHERVPEDRRSLVHRSGRRRPGRYRQEGSSPAREGRRRLRHRKLSRSTARPSDLVRSHHRAQRSRSPDAMARLGLEQRSDGLTSAAHPFLELERHMPKVLIADKLSPAAVAIFKERGVDADVKTGMTKEELLAVVDQYDGIALRSAT